jgi:hypothetical protein
LRCLDELHLNFFSVYEKKNRIHITDAGTVIFSRKAKFNCYFQVDHRMAFTFAAFSYIIALIVDAFLIFFAIFHVGFANGLMPDVLSG